jgi:hypothetical protein
MEFQTYHYVLAGFFTVWLILSILNNLKNGWWNAFKSYDWFAAVPSWSFFAPNPGRTDHQLLYRVRLKDDGWGLWNSVDLDSNKYWWQAFWNPIKRKNKALTDISSDLAFFRGEYSRESIAVTQAYLLLLNYVTNLPHPPGATSIEFVIMESYGGYNTRPPEVMFESLDHAL